LAEEQVPQDLSELQLSFTVPQALVPHTWALVLASLQVPGVHTPLVHVCPELQAFPQPAQFDVVPSCVSQPLAALPSQLPHPLLHAGTQDPEVHVVVPWELVHVPQLPQPLGEVPHCLPVQSGAFVPAQLPPHPSRHVLPTQVEEAQVQLGMHEGVLTLKDTRYRSSLTLPDESVHATAYW
jgi:hypothetical protein